MTWFVTAGAVVSGVVAIVCCAMATTRQRVTAVTVLLGLVVLVPATCAVLALGILRGLDVFGVAHVLYLQAALAVPMLGAGLLLLAVRRSISLAAAVASVVMLLPAPIGLWATHVAPFQLRVDQQRVRVTGVHDGSGTVRIAVLSDLQTTGVGEHERRAVQAILDAEPDIILLPGDLYQADGEVLAEHGPAVRELLGRLRAPGGVYLVQGDVDSPERWAQVVPPNLTLLGDEVVEVQVRDRRVRIGGTSLDVATSAADQVRSELLREDGSLTVLVSHRPDTALHLPIGSGVDLVVAGHTHGGQIALPWFGPPVTLTRLPRRIGAGGLHDLAGTPIYVSTGVGMERGQAPQIRLGVPPSVGILGLG